MKLFDKYRQDRTSEEEQAEMTELFIQKKFDQQLRSKMSARLEQDYGITRTAAGRTSAVRRQMIIRWASSIAAAILVGFAIWQIASPQANYQQLTDELLTAYVPSDEVRKGAGDFSEQRVQAINAYGRKEFAQSAQLRQVIVQAGAAVEEDFFYLGVSLLSQESPQPAAAVEALQQALAIPQGQLREEAEWYLSLAYLKSDRLSEARSLLTQIVNGNQWKAEPAARLLKTLPAVN